VTSALHRGRRAGLIGVLTLVLVACSEAASPPRFGAVPPPSGTPTAAPLVEASGPVNLLRADANAALCGLLADLDRDCDRRITIRDTGSLRDPARPGSDAPFPHAVSLGRARVTVASTSEAAQLVTELVVALRAPGDHVLLDSARVRLDPVSYLEHRIRGPFVDALTRRIDSEPVELARAATDQKVGAGKQGALELCPELEARCGTDPHVAKGPAPSELFVYFPPSDERARAVFERASVPGKLRVRALPEKVTPAWVRDITRAGEHGLLTLALDADGKGRPFVVPGGRFNEMYGWDSFFISWGLLEDPARIELARALVDNHAYEIERYGKILNANRTYYLTRSQPPLFAPMLAAVWRALPHDDANRAWLSAALGAALAEYRRVWSAPPRRLRLCEGDVCLARYFDEGTGEPPEVEPGAFDWFYQSHAVSHGHCTAPLDQDESRSRFLDCSQGLARAYARGALKDPAIDEFFIHDRAVRESGHDTTFRWFSGGSERCADFATVDLNALLFKTETELAALVADGFGGQLGDVTTAALCRRAEARARLVRRYLWDEAAGLFFDYDVKRKRRSEYVSATTLYPLWASTPNVCGSSLVTPAMARTLRSRALAELEAPGGLRATSERSLVRVEQPEVLRRSADGKIDMDRPGRQWEAPNGWAPHQMLAWIGLRSAGFPEDAGRLAYRWLYTIARNAADYHGTVPEKFDVERRSHAVFQEYGNVNTEFSYIAEEGFGWMNASFLVGLRELDPRHRQALHALEPPETTW
jgi:alpha,alpha-trehalase